MNDLEKVLFLCREVGRVKLFLEMGYSSAQNFYEWQAHGIPERAKPKLNFIFKKYKKLLESK